MKKDTETIKCPEYNAVQEATVLHTIPFWTYVHECKSCKYLITESESEPEQKINMKEKNNPQTNEPALSYWVHFNPNDEKTHPKTYGKYLVCRKDGKIHWETWNNNTWAYNQETIRYWAKIIPPS
jgi:hypothetical protein